MKYDVNTAVVRLSVTELCARALTSGDLDVRFGSGAVSDRAVLGSAAHRKLQSTAGTLYTPEVPLSVTVSYHGVCYEVSGRADGIIAGEPPTVDEIKTVEGKSALAVASPLHEAQLGCYAYFYCCQKNLASVRTRLTYYRLSDEKIKYVTSDLTREEAEERFFALLSKVEYRAKFLIEREIKLRPSAAGGRFPFPSVRDGQETLIKECYRDIRAGKRLFAEAPTGIGKTVSTLYPAVRALGEGHLDKIFYLTAKAATRGEAYRAVAELYRAGAKLRTVVLTAREQICFNDAAKGDPAGVSRHCNPDDCPFAKGFYDRLPTALCDLLSQKSGYPRRTVEEVARAYRLCPYEFQLELSEFCDTVICDYNYVFDPQVYLRRYFADGAWENEKYAFLVDEAHNLADRARAMYSAELKLADLTSLLSVLPEDDKLRKPLEKIAVTMTGFRRLCGDTLEKDDLGVERGYYVNHAPLESFFELIRNERPAVESRLRAMRGDVNESAAAILTAKLKRFACVAEGYDDAYLTFLTVEGDDRSIRLVCLDPSRELDRRMNRAYASVLFSATLTPQDYFADILGGGKNAVRLSLPSPFDPKNFCLAAVTGISTRYEEREKSYRSVVSCIAATASARPGNYIVYFPSYDYLEKVTELFRKKYPSVPAVVQKRGMNASEKEEFLGAFLPDGKLRVGFCVLGGSFSEGVDLPGDRLIGTVIVGTGLPGISDERNILRDYYETTRERGFDYAYVFPGMNRVLQAAGRVIRREDDRGVVVLIDDRYADPRMQSLFPDHWQGIQYAGNAAELAEITSEFWKSFKK